MGYSESAPQKRACRAAGDNPARRRCGYIAVAGGQVPENPWHLCTGTLAVPILSDLLYLLRTAVLFGPLNYALISAAKGKLGGGGRRWFLFLTLRRSSKTRSD